MEVYQLEEFKRDDAMLVGAGPKEAETKQGGQLQGLRG